ncbi:MAG: PilZ domain-containing protein [Candidatus Omnitrophota bacterium]|nr:PilZ domain-containing protein [Candidatus Omnitrophota bacterium]
MKSKKEIPENERREFIRLIYKSPLMYKVCKRKTISKLMQGYTQNISQAGLMCSIKESVPKDSTLWLKLDTGALNLCSEIEKRCVIIQQGILGKVAWLKKTRGKSVDVGVYFITREEKHPLKVLDEHCFS